MKLSIRHTFPCTPDEFWAAFWDPAYDEALSKGTAVRRELLEDRTDGNLRVQRFRFVPERTLPGPIAKLAGTDKLTYEQENRYDLAGRSCTWKVVPAVLTEKVTAEGVMAVRAAPEGCERVVEGAIDVRVPFVGSTIEKTIVESIESGYEQAAQVTREFLAARRG